MLQKLFNVFRDNFLKIAHPLTLLSLGFALPAGPCFAFLVRLARIAPARFME